MSFRLNCIIPEQCDLIANPVLEFFTFIKQIKRHWVYNKTLKKSILVYSHKFSTPIFLPEIGCLLSLDITSQGLSSDFRELQRIYDGYKSDNKILTTKLYNYRSNLNRAVSRGQYKLHTIDKKLYDIYLKNLETEISLTPSLSYRGIAFSPTRWFLLKSDRPHYLRCTLNYNYNIVYIKNDAFKSIKIENVWIDQLHEFYSIKVNFVKIRADGWTTIERTKLFFSENPEYLKEDISNKGEYYLCYSISLNDYTTSGPITFSDKNLNLVVAFDPIVYSACDIIPFLFPYYIGEDYLNDTIYRVNIPKKVVHNIIRRMNLFGTKQNPQLIKNYMEYRNKDNYFMRFTEEKDFYYIMSINPSIYPFMLKNYLCKNDPLYDKYFKIISESPELLLKKLHTYQIDKNKTFYLKYVLKNYLASSSFRKENYAGYTSAYDYCSTHQI